MSTRICAYCDRACHGDGDCGDLDGKHYCAYCLPGAKEKRDVTNDMLHFSNGGKPRLAICVTGGKLEAEQVAAIEAWVREQPADDGKARPRYLALSAKEVRGFTAAEFTDLLEDRLGSSSQIRLLLGELRNLLATERKKGGVRTDAVRDLVRRSTEKHPEFKRLALTLILICEALIGPPCPSCGCHTLRDADDPTRSDCYCEEPHACPLAKALT